MAQQAKNNRKENHEKYLEKIKRIEQSLKEKEIKTQREIDKIKKDNDELIKKIKEQTKKELAKLDLKNKKDLEELEQQYQNRINANANRIYQLILQLQNYANGAYNGI